MDWQLTTAGPAIHGLFWGLIRTPPEKRDHANIDESRRKTTAAMKILNAQLGKTAFVAGDRFSMGDIPVGLIAYRYCRLVPERTGLENLERWYKSLEQRAAFREQILPVPFV
jgi:glutathione S-transferase